MTVTILLFAGLRTRLSKSQIEVSVDTPAHVSDILRAIRSEYPQIAEQLDYCRVAVDQCFATNETVVENGSEVALIPPVSGGL